MLTYFYIFEMHRYQLALLLALSLEGVPYVVRDRKILTGSNMYNPLHHVYQAVRD